VAALAWERAARVAAEFGTVRLISSRTFPPRDDAPCGVFCAASTVVRSTRSGYGCSAYGCSAAHASCRRRRDHPALARPRRRRSARDDASSPPLCPTHPPRARARAWPRESAGRPPRAARDTCGVRGTRGGGGDRARCARGRGRVGRRRGEPSRCLYCDGRDERRRAVGRRPRPRAPAPPRCPSRRRRSGNAVRGRHRAPRAAATARGG
jgi:hypothetical protein